MNSIYILIFVDVIVAATLLYISSILDKVCARLHLTNGLLDQIKDELWRRGTISRQPVYEKAIQKKSNPYF
jgi:hypothetical protein